MSVWDITSTHTMGQEFPKYEAPQLLLWSHDEYLKNQMSVFIARAFDELKRREGGAPCLADQAPDEALPVAGDVVDIEAAAAVCRAPKGS